MDTPLYHAVINTSGGVLESFLLKAYKETIAEDSRNIDLITPQSLTKAPMGLIWNAQPTKALALPNSRPFILHLDFFVLALARARLAGCVA